MPQTARIRELAWPALIDLAVFFLLPVAIVACFSVLRRDDAGGVLPEFSAEAWTDAIRPTTLQVLCRSLGRAHGVTVDCLLVA